MADVATVDQLGLGDHGCWTFDDDREQVGVRLAGEADLSNRQALLALLGQLLDETAAKGIQVVVDLTEVTFFDAAAARALVRARTASRGRLWLKGASAGVARMLWLQGAGEVDDSAYRWPSA